MVFLGVVAILTTLINGIVLITESIRRCMSFDMIKRKKGPCAQMVNLEKIEKVD